MVAYNSTCRLGGALDARSGGPRGTGVIGRYKGITDMIA